MHLWGVHHCYQRKANQFELLEYEFIRILDNYAIGQTILIVVRRNDQIRTVEV